MTPKPHATNVGAESAPTTMPTPAPPPGPSTVACLNDPGDDTQRNFRYQHAFGVMLLVAGAIDLRPYQAIYCEHHEDLLPERADGRFDAYQIKTRKPEDGAWPLNHPDFERSIRRFVALDSRFPGQIVEFFFVSNAACLDAVQDDRPHRSPVKLLAAVNSAGAPADLSGRVQTAFVELRTACECRDDELWLVLRRLRLVSAPGRDDIFGALAHEHLPRLAECASLPAARLNDLRDELIDLVCRASSRAREDAARHFLPAGPERDEVRIRAKRVLVSDVRQRIQDRSSATLPPFRYTLTPERLSGASAHETLPILEKKLGRAGLHGQVDLMRRRALNAERYLLERLASTPGGLSDALLDHVTSVVSAECAEAHLGADVQARVPAGAWMLNDVYRRLQDKAWAQAAGVAEWPYEVLVGIAALLTTDCKVWWSEPFDLNEKAA